MKAETGQQSAPKKFEKTSISFSCHSLLENTPEEKEMKRKSKIFWQPCALKKLHVLLTAMI